LYGGNICPTDRRASFSTVRQLLDFCGSMSVTLPEAAVLYEQRLSGSDSTDTRNQMKRVLEVMRESARVGLEEPLHLLGGYVPGDDGKRLWRRVITGHSLSGNLLSKSVARAIAVMEVNASMGRVVAAPTAGSAGVVAGLLLSAGEELGSNDENLVDALFVAGVIGVLIGRTASFSGAMGGCQGEIGVASSIASAAITHLAGGDADEVVNAAALSIKNMLGLVCDPVAGPVEIPCIKRNAGGVAVALAAAEMALAGIRSAIPLDEVIMALKDVQDQMPENLRDNTLGGLGSTPTAAVIKKAWQQRCSGTTCPECER
jgi:L-serine dehydratase